MFVSKISSSDSPGAGCTSRESPIYSSMAPAKQAAGLG
jgi:hypothetical protein